MIGLAHRGWTLNDYSHHIVHTLREAGYWSGLIGEQHVSVDPEVLGYDRVVDIDTTRVESVAPAAVALLRERAAAAVLPVGRLLRDAPRVLRADVGPRQRSTRCRRATCRTRRRRASDMASYKASARSLDQGVGAVLNALDEHDIADDTLVILTTDHGLAFPGAKATLTDRGIGVLLIMRGPGGFHGGRVSDALVSQIDLYPDDLRAGRDRPPGLRCRAARSCRSMRQEVDEVNDAIFAELTYHAAYEPQRAIRTKRWKYIRRFGDARAAGAGEHRRRADARTSSSPPAGATARCRARRSTTCCSTPPSRTTSPTSRRTLGVLAELQGRLEAWMRETDDPLLDGDVDPPPGAVVNHPDALSASDPHGVLR